MKRVSWYLLLFVVAAAARCAFPADASSVVKALREGALPKDIRYLSLQGPDEDLTELDLSDFPELKTFVCLDTPLISLDFAGETPWTGIDYMLTLPESGVLTFASRCATWYSESPDIVEVRSADSRFVLTARSSHGETCIRSYNNVLRVSVLPDGPHLTALRGLNIEWEASSGDGRRPESRLAGRVEGEIRVPKLSVGDLSPIPGVSVEAMGTEPSALAPVEAPRQIAYGGRPWVPPAVAPVFPGAGENTLYVTVSLGRVRRFYELRYVRAGEVPPLPAPEFRMPSEIPDEVEPVLKVLSRERLNDFSENNAVSWLRLRPAPEGKLMVQWLSRESPFFAIGVRRGDTILSVNGVLWDGSLSSISESLASMASHDRLTLEILRDGKPLTLECEVR